MVMVVLPVAFCWWLVARALSPGWLVEVRLKSLQQCGVVIVVIVVVVFIIIVVASSLPLPSPLPYTSSSSPRLVYRRK